MDKALLTYRETGNLDERGPAKTTIGREQGSEQAFRSRADPGDEGSFNPDDLGPGRPS